MTPNLDNLLYTLELIVIKHFLMYLSLCFTVSYYSQKNGILYFLDLYTIGIMKTKIFWTEKQKYIFVIFLDTSFEHVNDPIIYTYRVKITTSALYDVVDCKLSKYYQLCWESRTCLCWVKLVMIRRIYFQEKCCHCRGKKCLLLLRKQQT